MVTEPVRRLFFALWPDAVTRLALYRVGAQLHSAWGGRRMREDSLHLTLAFLGETPQAQIERLCSLAASVTSEAFSLTLDHPGCWQHNHVGWLGVRQMPPGLAQLRANLAAALQAGEFGFDAQAFVPHVTLLRNAHCTSPPEFAPVPWRAERFALMASPRTGAGAGYTCLADWSLGASRT